jgi:hypothetical protein
MFSQFASPSLLARREILTYAAREAVQFGTTVRSVVDTFFAGRPRPGLQGFLDRMQAASGLPAPEAMALVSGFWEPELIEPSDLLVVLEQLAASGAMPTPEQARELVEAAQRLSRRARSHAKLVRAAQAAHDAEMVATRTEPPEAPPPTHHAVRARAVQRYSGLRASYP